MKNNNDLLDNDRFFVFLIFSIILHLILSYFFLFGSPSFYDKLSEEQVIVFEMLPIGEKSNVPNVKKQQEKAIDNEDARKVQHSKPITPQDPVITKPILPVLPKEETKTVEEKPVEEPKPAKEEKPAKPKTPVEDDKPKEPKNQIPDTKELDALLGNLEQNSEGKNSKSNKQTRTEQNNNSTDSEGSHDDTKPLSLSEIALIKQQINWSSSIIGEKARIEIYISLNQDGSVQEVKIKEKICTDLSPAGCQALEDGAYRAIWKASPFQNLDPKRYENWKEFIFNFL